MTQLAENLGIIRENIANAARKSGRSADEISLIAVTKTIEPERVCEILKLNIRSLGENKAQELLTKYGLFEPEPDWHLIGHLQTNKVKYIIDKVCMIQSLDSIKLAAEIDKRAKQIDRIMDILVEVNIGNEDTKYGLKCDQIGAFVEHLSIFSNIRMKGFMCVAPFVKKPDENRHLYEKMLQLLVDTQLKCPHNTDMQILSMGMTNDYVAAIEEGANMVRIGTALFGGRT